MSRSSLDLACRAAPRGPRGQVTWVTVALIAVGAGAAYWGWAWAPVYLDHYAARQVVRDYMNQAVKNRDDESLRAAMVHKLRVIREIDGVDARGRPSRLPAITVEEREVVWDRSDGPPPTLHVAFDYVREVTYPFLDRTSTKVFTVDETNDLTVPDWGPSR